MPFDKNKFCNENKVWDYLRPYLHDRPQQKWTTFSITGATKGVSKNRSLRKKLKKIGTRRIK
jgi:hypothetical protein